MWTEAKHTQKFQHREGSNENETERKVREPTNAGLMFSPLDHETISGFMQRGKRRTDLVEGHIIIITPISEFFVYLLTSTDL